jgi:hypothetical protein
MRNLKAVFMGVFCILLGVIAPSSFAGGEIVLVGGTRAVIEGKQLVLIGKDSRRSVAPPGRYDTLDGRYSIIVKGKDIAIVDHSTVLR